MLVDLGRTDVFHPGVPLQKSPHLQPSASVVGAHTQGGWRGGGVRSLRFPCYL